MFSRLKSFLDNNKILNDNQYGFRANHSTELAVLEFTQKVLSNMNKKLITLGIFIDLSKAFDVINHALLLKKLNAYGIRGVANQWFESYLNDRNQYVTIGNENSEKLTISSGVPQGSILGPTLFTLFINDLCNINDNVNFLLYADDTTIFFPTKNPSTSIDEINKYLKEVTTWFSKMLYKQVHLLICYYFYLFIYYFIHLSFFSTINKINLFYRLF